MPPARDARALVQALDDAATRTSGRNASCLAMGVSILNCRRDKCDAAP